MQNNHWKHHKRTIYNVWSNKSKLQIMFLMNCWKYPRWSKTHKTMMMKKWQIFLETKMRFLVNEIFSTSFSSDLSDNLNAIYLSSMHWSPIVKKKKVIEVMKKFNLNKIFKSNNITNRFLKIFGKDLINVLILFFQTCVNQNYYFKMYQKKNTMILCKSDEDNYDVVKT